MRQLKMIMAVAAVAGLLAAAGFAQQQMPMAPSAGMQGGMAMCSQMMTQHQEMATLTQKILDSFASLQNEKDPATLQKKLAEHGALLKELQTKESTMQTCPMMQGGQMGNMPGGMQGMGNMRGGQMGNMPGGMMGPMTGSQPKK
jgi:hypothetical protein